MRLVTTVLKNVQIFAGPLDGGDYVVLAVNRAWKSLDLKLRLTDIIKGAGIIFGTDDLVALRKRLDGGLKARNLWKRSMMILEDDGFTVSSTLVGYETLMLRVRYIFF